MDGREGSELYHRATDPTQTQNVLAAHRAVAEEHFEMLRAWLDQLAVPPARQRQLLHAEKFGWFDRAKHRLWLSRNRRHYRKHYGNYHPAAA